jgi:predicted lipid-binding transport protein (Tim44 family)
MEGFQFIDIIILAMIAGFIILRLKSTLGRRTGHDPRTDKTRPGSYGRDQDGSNDNVVVMPENQSHQDAADIEPAYQGTALEPGLVQIKMADSSFSATQFLEGASKAFEFIVMAFANNNTDTLKPLLSPDVFSRFASAIQDREDRGETRETELAALRPPKLEVAEIEGSRAMLVVRFQSDQVNVVKDKDGNIIDGDRDHIETVTDIWTFARELHSDNPNWQLVSTSSEEE